MRLMQANTMAADGTPCFASHLGLFCLPLSHKKDAMLKRDKSNRKAMNRNWSNQKANPALKTKAGNK